MITLTGHCLNCGKYYATRQESIYSESGRPDHECKGESE
jgi:hypothetical protein